MARFTSSKPSINLSTPQSKNLSPYAQLLMELTNTITDTEFSQMRMALSADNHIKVYKQGSLRNIAELLEYMDSKKLIARSNLNLLHTLMGLLKREDLKSKIEDYELAQLAFPEGAVCGSRPVQCRDAGTDKLGEQSVPDNLDEDNLPGSQESMKSLSDDEKLLRNGTSELTDKLLDDDVQMMQMSGVM